VVDLRDILDVHMTAASLQLVIDYLLGQEWLVVDLRDILDVHVASSSLKFMIQDRNW
jgi:hypothetical protein